MNAMAIAELQSESLSIPLEGLSEAEIKLNFGGGELVIGQADQGTLISGQFEGGVIEKSKGRGKIELEPHDPARAWMAGCSRRWDVALTTEIPVDLRLDTGANQSIIDLTPLRIRRLELHTGASDTTIRLPAVGQTSVRVECGFAQVTIEVPRGIEARIRGKIALGSTDVDETRFPRFAGGGWASAGYESALNRVEIEVAGGFGSVRIA
jgi:hypothetical protein